MRKRANRTTARYLRRILTDRAAFERLERDARPEEKAAIIAYAYGAHEAVPGIVLHCQALDGEPSRVAAAMLALSWLYPEDYGPPEKRSG